MSWRLSTSWSPEGAIKVYKKLLTIIFTKLEIVSWLSFGSLELDCRRDWISIEFRLEMEGVEKALLLNSRMPSRMMLLEVSFWMWIVSLNVGLCQRDKM